MQNKQNHAVNPFVSVAMVQNSNKPLLMISFREKPLSPELVAAATAVADSLPFDKQKTKSDLLRQLQQHEEASWAQKDQQRPKIRSVNHRVLSVRLTSQDR